MEAPSARLEVSTYICIPMPASLAAEAPSILMEGSISRNRGALNSRGAISVVMKALKKGGGPLSIAGSPSAVEDL